LVTAPAALFMVGTILIPFREVISTRKNSRACGT
jgi:hypothetical protein